MPAARHWIIQIFPTGHCERIIEGAGKAKKESELRRICTETALSTGGEVWVTEMNARAWQVWDCKKGERFATRGRVILKTEK